MYLVIQHTLLLTSYLECQVEVGRPGAYATKFPHILTLYSRSQLQVPQSRPLLRYMLCPDIEFYSLVRSPSPAPPDPQGLAKRYLCFHISMASDYIFEGR
jgi:hypothetical protein